MFTEGKEIDMFRVCMATYLVLLLLQSPALAKGDLTDILEGIRKNYGDLPGLTLSYSREVITKTMAMLGDQVKGDLATGRMFFKPPCFLRLNQETPKPETVISDEDTIWWYIPDENRAYKSSAKEFGKELRLLSDIFQGLIQVHERFQVTLLDPNELGEDQIELKPKTPWENIDRIILAVTAGHHIRIVGIHYQLGSVTLFTLKDIAAKQDFEKDFFTFVVPEGVKIVEEKGQQQ
jgi:outer membrane lipoprotein-sorting protein